jgi:ABC-type antimicrobial peptide transport system permease subunit
MTLFAIMSVVISLSVVAGAFSFGIALRRQELALLRLVGASGEQLKKMIMGESLIISAAAGFIGTILSLAVSPLFFYLLNQTDIIYLDLNLSNLFFIPLIIAFGISFLTAILGATFALNRVNNITPVEVLKESSIDAKVMTKGGIIAGCITFVVATTLFLLAFAIHFPEVFYEYDGIMYRDPGNTIFGMIMVIFGTICLSIAATKLGPLYLPLLGYLIISPFMWLISGNLTRSSIITSKRRTTSLIAPIIISISLIVVMSFIMEGMLLAFTTELENSDIPPLGTIMIILAIPSIIFTAISIVNTQIMAYSVRKADIANMRLLGVSKVQIILTAVWEPLVISVLGIAAGLGIAFLGAGIFNQSVARDFGVIPFAVPWGMIIAMVITYLVAAIVSAAAAVNKILSHKQQALQGIS